MNNKTSLPKPDEQAAAHSAKLATVIADEIQQKNSISFQRFMQMALYQPGLGYYSAGAHKFGAAGDFVTAPELSSAFCWCVAQQCQPLMALDHAQILELGAGTGKLALEILQTLEAVKQLPERYLIIEVSADLRQRQQQLFQKQAPHLLDRVKWLDSLPDKPINGLILANEVMDAMPVHRICLNESIDEYFVGYNGQEFFWEKQACQDPVLLESIQQSEIKNLIGDTPNYHTEINPALPAWIHSLSDCLQSGCILLIDYGYTRQEYFHPQRHMGTLMCHYRHRAHDNPLIFPGIQDITTHVDFTGVAEAALTSNLEVSGFTHQAAFLLNCGLMNYADQHHSFEIAQQVKRLTLPSEMGERFKAIALTRNFNEPLTGFTQFDQTERL